MAKVVGRASSEALPCGGISIVTTSASDLTISRSLVSKGASGALLDAQFGISVGVEESRTCGIESDCLFRFAGLIAVVAKAVAWTDLHADTSSCGEVFVVILADLAAVYHAG
jgi:hypothetical protein